MILQLWQSYIPSVVLSLRLPRDFHIGSNNHNVQNALTSSYCNQNCTAIRLFFRYWRFWTRQNDCIALTAIHSLCCVKPSIHAGLQHPLYQPLHIECIGSILLQPELQWYSTILSTLMLLDILKQFYPSTAVPYQLPFDVLLLPLTRDSHFAWSPTMYRMHWHHPTAAKSTLPFIYSFTIDVFGHVKLIV
jgi:hypothetical protein